MTVFRQTDCAPVPFAPGRNFHTLVLLEVFCTHPTAAGVAQALQVIRQAPSQEIIMKLQLGQNQLVLELSSSPFAWFHGQTERMSLTSLSLMFVQFSLFARQPAA